MMSTARDHKQAVEMPARNSFEVPHFSTSPAFSARLIRR